MKRSIATKVMDRLPEAMTHLEDYARDSMDVRNLLIEKMQQLDELQFEALIRPAFEQDEWILITVGAALGFFMGEAQALVLGVRVRVRIFHADEQRRHAAEFARERLQPIDMRRGGRVLDAREFSAGRQPEAPRHRRHDITLLIVEHGPGKAGIAPRRKMPEAMRSASS